MKLSLSLSYLELYSIVRNIATAANFTFWSEPTVYRPVYRWKGLGPSFLGKQEFTVVQSSAESSPQCND
eukprot:COSAG02_NODE_5189_length_4555_cov_10.704668_4_plen_69_part_00